jgi:2,6-dihydroxypyridine 3-monooxygenase
MGGSLGGLTAALVLRDAGCDVRVYERSAAALEARGAGLAVLDETLRYFVERRRVSPDTICSTTNWIRFLHADGTVQFEQRRRYRFSSWNTIYRALLECIEPDRYLLGHEVRTFSSDVGSVEVGLADGRRLSVELLVCADGINSTARQTLLPDVRPQYSGYVAWRGTLPESTLTPRTHDVLHDAITYQVLPSSHVLVYPIPGPDGSLADGQRLVNFVWYRNVKQGADLDALMTDCAGVRHSVSLPPGTARDSAVDEMRASARAQLASPIAEAVTGVDKPFVQAVYDVEVPRMVVGRVCLIGDAAFAVRPHAAAGTAKAAADGWALAEALTASGGCVPAALARWEARQLALGRSLLQRTREIGDSSQFTGAFRPGDPRLIFGLYEPGR